MIKGILVALDASEASLRALEVAVDLARKYGVQLNLLHVVRDMQLPDSLRAMARVEKIEGQRLDVLKFVAQKILSEAERRAQEQGVKTVRTEIGEGDPATTIINRAKRNGADLIVLGTRGLGEVKSMFLGSVSRKVSNLAEVNCLIVK